MTTHHAQAKADHKSAARRKLRPERSLPQAPLAAGPRAATFGSVGACAWCDVMRQLLRP